MNIYERNLQRSIFELTELCKEHGLDNHQVVREAKELIRCSMLGCGLAGACNGHGLPSYPCPLRNP